MAKWIPFHRVSLTDAELKNIRRVLNSGWLTTGKETQAFEKEFSRYCQADYAVAVNSCTAAMHLSLTALDIGKGDTVITSPFTFASTANVILHSGANIRFVDINDDDFTLDLDKAEQAVTRKTTAIIPVHFGGAVCDLERLEKLKRKTGIKIIQDAAHCLEGRWNGKSISSYGDTACFSFYATKNITTGEGGMVTTSHAGLADKMRILSLHGLSRNAWKRYSKGADTFYQVLYPGFKYNMFDIQAAIGRAQLKRITTLFRKRQALDKLYRSLLSAVEGLRFQKENKKSRHARHIFVVDLNTKKSRIKRQELIKAFQKSKIGYSVHFLSLHRHPYYKKRYGFRKNDFPVASRLSDEIISLPFYPDMPVKAVERVVRCIKKVYKK